MFSELIYWRDNLGLLPVNLEHNQDKVVRKYAMLDGDVNNFGLAFVQQGNEDNYRDKAWSANMHNFVTVQEDKLMLYRTSGDNKEEYNYSFVKSNLSNFYKYLAIKQEKEPKGVVSFIMEEYAKIRTALREINGDGVSLTALLYLLTSVNHKVTPSNLNNFGLPENTFDIINNIKDNSLIDQIVEEVKKGAYGFKPDISLLLRHAAGKLFEEANFMATFDPQLNLFPSKELKYIYNPSIIGVYYTPTYIARSVVDYALNHYDLNDKDKITIFDPACGSGEFLVESLRQLKSIGYDREINIIGYDLSQSATIIANYVLAFESREWGGKLKFIIENKDSIIDNWPKVDLLFMNPPYSSWEQMNNNYIPYIRENLGIKKGRPNVASIFYHKAVRSLNDNGIVGSVMPTAFLYSEYTEPIRNKSLEYATPMIITRLGNFVFPKAYVDVCSVISKRSNDVASTQMVWTNNVEKVVPEAIRQLRISSYNETKRANSINFSTYSVNTKEEIKGKNIWMPLSADKHAMQYHIENLKYTGLYTSVGKLFNVCQGARTGKNDIFEISKEEFEQLSEREKVFFRPVINSEAIKNNRIVGTDYIFFPYDSNGLTILTEEELQEKVPWFYSRIKDQKTLLIEKRPALSEKWWSLTRPREWQYEICPKIISGEFGNSKNFTIDIKGNYIVERGNAWINKDLSREDMFAYLAIFSSPYFDDLLSIYSRQLAGGYWYNLGKTFVQDIPLPKLTYHPDEKKWLVNIGKEILSGNGYDANKHNYIVKGIYGQV